MPIAPVNGMDVYYERSGPDTGPRLLWLNGSGSTIANTGPVLEPFRSRFDLLVHDQRGLGRTTIPPGPYTIEDYAADALALLDLVGWSSCRVIGVSFGGMVAQELAVTAPDRVERLVLACTSPGGPGASSYPLHELAALDEAEREERARLLLDSRFTADHLRDHPADRALVEMMAARRRPVADPERRRGEWEQMMARRSHDVTDRLARISCPTLVAAGRYDGIAPVANSEAIVARVPGAELRVYEGGHLFFVQDRRAVPEMIEFLGGP